MNSEKNIILVIDDELNNIKIIENYLKASGFETAIARDGFSGLEMAKKLSPDLILLDIVMPDMDGFETCRKLKEDPLTNDIPVVFMTALDRLDDKVNAFSCGGVDYITRPTPRQEILARVKTHLNLKNAYKRLQKQNLLLEREIDARKKNENMLKKYKTAFSATQDLISLLDKNYRYVMVNESYLKAHNKRYEDIVGRTVADLMGESVFENHIKRNLDRCWKGEIINFDHWFNLAGYGKRYMSVNYSPFWDENKQQVTMIVAIARDITEQKRAEEEIRNAREAAEAANRTKSSFLANMSHEIRTPMNSVINFARVLKDTPLTEEQKEYTEIIISSSNILLSLINDILDFSKIEAGKLEISKSGFLIKDITRDIEDILSARARKKGLDFTVNIDEGVPEKVYGDPVRIEQIILNFANNAVKFTPEGSVSIRISVDERTESEATICFSVSDTGIGIPGDKMNQLFNPFSQIDPSVTRKYGGTGLGLAISNQLSELMDGRIDVESVEGKGSCFRFTVTLQSVEETQLNSQHPPSKRFHGEFKKTAKRYSLSDLRILLAEDNNFNQKLLLALLSKYGPSMDVAETGTEVLEKLRNEDYDLVLMDIQMPEMDGIQATQAIRAGTSNIRNPAVPIIAMTAHAMKGDREKFIDAGMNDYVSKPIDPPLLIDIIQQVLEIDAVRASEENSRSGGADTISSPPGPDPPSFNKNELLRRIGDHPEDCQGILETFAVSVFVELHRIREGLAESDLKTAAIKAHSIKGMAGNISAPKLRETAICLETALKAGAVDDASAMIPEIEREAKMVIADIVGAGLAGEEILTAYENYISFKFMDSETISKIPPDIASRLLIAAERLDMEILEEIITELHADLPEIAAVFKRLADNFNYGEIQNLLKKGAPPAQ